MIGIYKIENPFGKVYIGQSTNIAARIDYYKKATCKDQPLLYNSLKKYGFLSHSIKVICQCEVAQLNKLERFFISMYKSNDSQFGLNLTTGGQICFYHNAETKLKMSQAQMGNKKRVGKKQTAEEIEKRVRKLKGQKRTKECKEKMSKARMGMKMSDETKRKFSIAKTGFRSKKIINTSTSEVFANSVLAAQSLSMKKTTLVAMLNGQNKNSTNLKYL